MKKILIYALFVLIVGGWGYYYYKTYSASAQKSNIRTRNATVTQWSIKKVVKATGKVFSVKSSNLAFAKPGIVTAIYKKNGDAVKAGELIAEVDAKSAKLDVANAQVSLNNAKNNLQKILNWATETDKIKAQNSLTESQGKLSIVNQTYDSLVLEQNNAISTSEANIKALQEKLDLAKSLLDYAQKNAGNNTTSNDIERDVANGYSLIESTYQVITPSLKTISDTLLLNMKDDPAYGALSENNPALKAQVESLYAQVQTESIAIQDTLTDVRAHTDSLTSVLTGLTEMRKLVGDLNSLVSIAVSELRASTTGSALDSGFLDQKIATMEDLSSNISGKYSNVNSSFATLKNYGNDSLTALSNKNDVATKQTAVTSATNDLKNAQANLEQTKKDYAIKLISAQQDIDIQNNTIKLNQSSYNDTIKWAESTDIASARNNVQSAEISLEKAQLTLSDYQIHASFDGTIKDIPWTVGDTALATDTVSVDTTGGYEIDVSLDQVDIIKVKTGMQANISLDAYANSSYSGVVSSVSTNPTETSNVVSYTAKILLPEMKDSIFDSMSATVEIIVAQKDNVLLIPSNAIKTASGETYVEVIDGSSANAQTIKTPVTLWVTDDADVEVLSGVTLGQHLKIQTPQRNGWTGSGAARATTFGLGGIWGGGWGWNFGGGGWFWWGGGRGGN